MERERITLRSLESPLACVYEQNEGLEVALQVNSLLALGRVGSKRRSMPSRSRLNSSSGNRRL